MKLAAWAERFLSLRYPLGFTELGGLANSRYALLVSLKPTMRADLPGPTRYRLCPVCQLSPQRHPLSGVTRAKTSEKVAGAGFAHGDLRIMSPTRFLTSPSRNNARFELSPSRVRAPWYMLGTLPARSLRPPVLPGISLFRLTYSLPEPGVEVNNYFSPGGARI